jgi:hypothetical protein
LKKNLAITGGLLTNTSQRALYKLIDFGGSAQWPIVLPFAIETKLGAPPRPDERGCGGDRRPSGEAGLVSKTFNVREGAAVR